MVVWPRARAHTRSATADKETHSERWWLRGSSTEIWWLVMMMVMNIVEYMMRCERTSKSARAPDSHFSRPFALVSHRLCTTHVYKLLVFILFHFFLHLFFVHFILSLLVLLAATFSHTRSDAVALGRSFFLLFHFGSFVVSLFPFFYVWMSIMLLLRPPPPRCRDIYNNSHLYII